MDTNGCPLVVHGHPLVSIDIHGHPMEFIDFHNNIPIIIISSKRQSFSRTSIGFHWCSCIPMDIQITTMANNGVQSFVTILQDTSMAIHKKMVIFVISCELLKVSSLYNDELQWTYMDVYGLH